MAFSRGDRCAVRPRPSRSRTELTSLTTACMNCVLALLSLLVALAMPGPAAAGERWSEQQARDWYRDQRWILGANYIPATAINQLEMWQADSFDPQRIDLELGWAEAIGMNSMRVFLHDLLWRQDAE